MNDANPFYILGCVVLAASLGYVIYASGFVYGVNVGYYGVNKPHVKKRIVKEGNIIKYPFRGTLGQEAETSDSNCVLKSGVVKEEVTQTKET